MNVESDYAAAQTRYDEMTYRRSGRSGLLLPAISLGLWLNFGDDRPYSLSRNLILHAFDRGITHFDLANNYGPPNGSAEKHFGRMLARDLRRYRDELIISTKAGFDMWPGPYGNFCSRKYLLASLDQSLARMGLDYVDIFYSHRYDPDTPLEETMEALDTAVKSGKALYVGLSTYPADTTREAVAILRELRTPVVIHQPSYSMVNRWIEQDVLTALEETGLGCIVFSALAQGLLSERYLSGIPGGSRAADRSHIFREQMLGPDNLERIRGLAAIAASRGQSLPQMAIAWVLRQPGVTSALLGASSVRQLDDSLAALENLTFDGDELAEIDKYATEAGVNLWRPPAVAGARPPAR